MENIPGMTGGPSSSDLTRSKGPAGASDTLIDVLQNPVQEQGDVFVLRANDIDMILPRIDMTFLNSPDPRHEGTAKVNNVTFQHSRFIITRDNDGKLGLFSRPWMFLRFDSDGYVTQDVKNATDTFPKVLSAAQKENQGKQIIMDGCGYIFYDYQTNTLYFWGESQKYGGFDQQIVKEIISQFGDSIKVVFENPIKQQYNK